MNMPLENSSGWFGMICWVQDALVCDRATNYHGVSSSRFTNGGLPHLDTISSEEFVFYFSWRYATHDMHRFLLESVPPLQSPTTKNNLIMMMTISIFPRVQPDEIRKAVMVHAGGRAVHQYPGPVAVSVQNCIGV
jgi:hypothetical protein